MSVIKCNRCGAEITAASAASCPLCGMTLAGREYSPDDTGAERQPPNPPVPWEAIDSKGVVRAMTETAYQCLFRPSQFFSGLTQPFSVSRAWLYALVAGSVGCTAGFALNSLAVSLLPSEPALFGDLMFPRHGAAAAFIFSPVLTSIEIVAVAAYAHVMLALSGNARAPFKATFGVSAYAQTASLLAAIPFLGSLLVIVWLPVLVITGIHSVHAIPRSRALRSLALPLIWLGGAALFLGIAALAAAGILIAYNIKELADFFR
jgi:hypothetical protein